MSNCELKNLPPIIITLIVIFSIINSSMSSPLENDSPSQLLVLTARVDSLQSKMEQITIQLEEEKILRGHLQAVNSELDVKINKLTAENQNQEEKIQVLMAKGALQEETIRILKNTNINLAKLEQKSEKYESSNNNQLEKNVANTRMSDSPSSPRLPPSSCRQLSTIGHYLDGIYLITNPDTNKIEAVFCDFESSTLSETLYGSVDVKSQSVHFFVQRSSDFTLTNAVIPFDLERLNIGGAMNLATGIFTVPVDGIYHFEFSGVKDPTAAELAIYLQVNGVKIGVSYGTSLPNYLGLSGINASLRLKVEDQVRLYKVNNASLNDDGNHFTHFSGWLVEEDHSL